MQLAVAGLLLATGAGATEPARETAPRTLPEYLAMARANNPSLKASFTDASAARERVGIARGYPDPLLMYGYMVSPDPMRGRQSLELIQPIPFPGKRGLRGDVARSGADIVASSADAYALDVDLEVATAFYDYVRVREVGRVLLEERAVVARMRDVAGVRYGAGTAEQQEVLKLDLSISQIDDAIAVNSHEDDRVRIRLNELLGRDPETALPMPEWSVPDVDTLLASADADSAIRYRPEVAGAAAGISMAESMHRLARREYLPNFMLGAMFEYGADADQTWELRAGIELPIWLGKTRAMVNEATELRASAAQRLEAEKLRVRKDVSFAMHGIYNARDRQAKFESRILPQADLAFRSSEAGYRAGRVDFLDYLDSERTLLELRRQYVEVIADLGIQVAALQRALGRPIAANEETR